MREMRREREGGGEGGGGVGEEGGNAVSERWRLGVDRSNTSLIHIWCKGSVNMS